MFAGGDCEVFGLGVMTCDAFEMPRWAAAQWFSRSATLFFGSNSYIKCSHINDLSVHGL